MQSTFRHVGHLVVESLIDGSFNFYLRFQQMFEYFTGDLLWQTLVDDVGSMVEDVAEDTVVQFLLVIRLVGFLDICHIAVVELQGTAHVAVDGTGRKGSRQQRHDVRRLSDIVRCPAFNSLARLQCALSDGLSALYHQLKHEAAHLAALSVFRRVVPKDSDIAGTLQQPMEVVGVDAHLVFYGCQLIGLADAVGYERAVVDASWHVAFVAGEQ